MAFCQPENVTRFDLAARFGQSRGHVAHGVAHQQRVAMRGVPEISESASLGRKG